MKIIVEIDLDQVAYDAKYGPGTEWWASYRTDRKQVGDKWVDFPLPTEAYEFAPAKRETTLAEMVKDIIEDGFHDWKSLREENEGNSALQIKVTFPETAKP